MDTLTQSLEAWRERQGLNKTQMASLLKANTSQVYSNWIGRGEVSKKFIDIARLVVSCDDIQSAKKAIASNKSKALLSTNPKASDADIRDDLMSLANDGNENQIVDAIIDFKDLVSQKGAIRIARAFLEAADG